MTKYGDRDGFVLFSVIWIAGLLAVVATAFAISTRFHVRAQANLGQAYQAELIADGLPAFTGYLSNSFGGLQSFTPSRNPDGNLGRERMAGYVRLGKAALISVIGLLLVVLPISAETRKDSVDVVEIGDPKSKDKILIDREMLTAVVNIDREITALGIRLFDYDMITVGRINDELFGLQVIRIPKDGIDAKGPAVIRDGFKAVLDARTFKLIKMFKLEGGEIALP